MSRYYHICHANIGRAVDIRTLDNRIYTGTITRVTRSHVYMTSVGRPVGENQEKVNARTAISDHSKVEGEQILFGFGIALAAIAAIAAAGAFRRYGGYRPYGGYGYY
jgi:hypothetical protein